MTEFKVYVDDRYIETIATRWSIERLMAQLRKKYEGARSIEVKKRYPPESRSEIYQMGVLKGKRS